MSGVLESVVVCRVGADTVQCVRTGRGLAWLMLRCAVTIAVGAAAYGATIGMWRGPLQASYAAIKLAILFGALFVLTTFTHAVMGGLLRSRLSFRQVAACCLLGLAITAALLGALAPVSWFIVAHAPAASTDHDATLFVAHALLTGHVVVLAFAGMIGVRRVYGLLGQLIDDPAVVRRVLWVWLAVEGLVGAELSWILRPFLGKPDLDIAFLRSDAFERSFFDEVGRMTRGLLGSSGPWIALALVVIATVVIAKSLDARVVARFRIHASGLTLQHVGGPHAFELAWADIRFVRVAGTDVEVGRFDPAAMRTDVLVLGCDGESSARAAFEAIESARHGDHAPFRREPFRPSAGEPMRWVADVPPDSVCDQAVGWLRDCAARVEPHDDPATLARILATTPVPPSPSRLARWAERPWRRSLVVTPAGPAWHQTARFDFVTRPVPVQVIWLGQGVWVATLHSSAWPALAGAFARHALTRICQARGWRFPEDVETPEGAELIWSLVWAGEPPLELDPGTLERLRFGGGEGSLLLRGRWRSSGKPGRVRLRWSQETLLIQDVGVDERAGLAGHSP